MKKPAKKKPVEAGPMTGEEFWTKLQKLGFSQVGFGRTINVGGRTVRGWIAGDFPVPVVVAMLINLMLKTKTTAEDLKP